MNACPRRLGRYLLEHRLARGGMAEIYRAHADDDPSPVAIKTIRDDLASDPETLALFAREAQIVGRLRHPRIVRVHEIGWVEGTPYLVMEHLDGLDLMRLFRAVQRAGDGFPAAVVATIGHAVADALAHAHAQPQPIVHRDVTPHNVMVTRTGAIKLLDFGIAHDDPCTARAGTTRLRGKVAYLSPEQVRGEPIGPSTDVYALGLVMFELLSGRLWFRHRDRNTALAMVRREPVPPLRRVAPAVPPGLATIVDRAVQPLARERYPDARAMQTALADVLTREVPELDAPRLATFVRRYDREEDEPRAAAPPTTRPRHDPSAPHVGSPRASASHEASQDAARLLPDPEAGTDDDEPVEASFEAAARHEHHLRHREARRLQAAALRTMAALAGTPEQRAWAGLARLRFFIELPRLTFARAALAAWEGEVCPPALRAWRADLAAMLARHEGDLEQAEARLLTGLAACNDGPEDARARIRLLRGLALVHRDRGAVDMARACLAQALQAAERVDAPRWCAAILTAQAELALREHDDEEAIDRLRRAARYDRALGDHHAGAKKLAGLGWAYARLGMTGAAERALRQALRRLSPLGPASELARLHVRLARVRATSDPTGPDVGAHLDTAARLARTSDAAERRRIELAVVELAPDRPAGEVRARGEALLRQARAADDPEVEARALDALARWESATGRPDLALVYATEAVAALRRARPLWEAPRLLARCSTLRTASGDHDGAATLVTEAREILRRRHVAFGDPRLAEAFLRLHAADPVLVAAGVVDGYWGTKQIPIAARSGSRSSSEVASKKGAHS